jgi:Tat protein secretion system quality control protein TatD with DNase activity
MRKKCVRVLLVQAERAQNQYCSTFGWWVVVLILHIYNYDMEVLNQFIQIKYYYGISKHFKL